MSGLNDEVLLPESCDRCAAWMRGRRRGGCDRERAAKEQMRHSEFRRAGSRGMPMVGIVRVEGDQEL